MDDMYIIASVAEEESKRYGMFICNDVFLLATDTHRLTQTLKTIFPADIGRENGVLAEVVRLR